MSEVTWLVLLTSGGRAATLSAAVTGAGLQRLRCVAAPCSQSGDRISVGLRGLPFDDRFRSVAA